MKQQAEIEQWIAFINGDIAAFDAIMTQYFRDLYQYGSKFSSDTEFVKDAIQDLFLYLWEHREHLAQTVSVKAYLMASLRRRIHRSKNGDFLDKSIVEESRLLEMEFSVEEAFIENEQARHLSLQIKNVLTALPKRQKEIVYLRFFQNLDRDQIAQVLNITPQTVSNILQMAFKGIRKHWANEYFGLFLLHFFFNT
jgi:RNA polymerase sigma factor (sigma-70 family)